MEALEAGNLLTLLPAGTAPPSDAGVLAMFFVMFALSKVVPLIPVQVECTLSTQGLNA